MNGSDLTRHRVLITILTGTEVVVGAAVAVFTADVIIGVAPGAGFIAVANRWSANGPVTPVPRRPSLRSGPQGTGFHHASAGQRWESALRIGDLRPVLGDPYVSASRFRSPAGHLGRSAASPAGEGPEPRERGGSQGGDEQGALERAVG